MLLRDWRCGLRPQITMKLDPHTFGGSKACEILSKVLEEQNDPKLVSKIGCSLAKFHWYMNQVNNKYLLNLVLKDFSERIKDNLSNWPGSCVTLTINIMTTRYRIRLKEIKCQKTNSSH